MRQTHKIKYCSFTKYKNNYNTQQRFDQKAFIKQTIQEEWWIFQHTTYRLWQKWFPTGIKSSSSSAISGHALKFNVDHKMGGQLQVCQVSPKLNFQIDWVWPYVASQLPQERSLAGYALVFVPPAGTGSLYKCLLILQCPEPIQVTKFVNTCLPNHQLYYKFI